MNTPHIKLFLFLIITNIYFSQELQGTLRGSVKDQIGNALPGVQVYLEDSNKGSNTDQNGNYNIQNIEEGLYSVTSQMIGYNSVTSKDVNIIADQIQWLNFTLEEESLAGQSVTISADRNNKDIEAQEISLESALIRPTISIRYENFMEELSPGIAIGVRLDLDDTRYTGFEVNTDQENFDSRILFGWDWMLIGFGTKVVDSATYPSFTFGGSYGVLNNLTTNIEYVTTPSSELDIDDHIRLAVLITL